MDRGHRRFHHHSFDRPEHLEKPNGKTCCG